MKKRILSAILAAAMIIMILPAISLPVAAEVTTRGDVNEDGAVNNSDLIALNKYLCEVGGIANSSNADVTADGTVDEYDLIALKSVIALTGEAGNGKLDGIAVKASQNMGKIANGVPITPYAVECVEQNDNATHTFAFYDTANYPVPYGFTIDNATGVITGTPQSDGEYEFAVSCDGLWGKVKCTVVFVVSIAFDVCGGTGGTSATAADCGSDMREITCPTKEGYTFAGYYTEPNGTGTRYYDSTGNSARKCDLTEATKLYAHWVNKRAIVLGAAGVIEGNKVYYGNYSSPIMWRVLSLNGNGGTYDVTGANALFLLSENTLPKPMFHTSSNEWQGSNAQAWCTNFYDGGTFSDNEQALILATTKSDDAHSPFSAVTDILNKDKVFFLSAEEADTYFPGSSDRVANYGDATVFWWLRSPKEDDTRKAGIVNRDGNVHYGFVNDSVFARPAFNLDETKILFTSAAVGGKSAAGMSSGLTTVSQEVTTAWKLTLKDSDHTLTTATTHDNLTENSTITVSYTGASAGHTLSGVIVDSDDNVLYYGNFASVTTAEGTQQITLPSDFNSSTMTLKLFTETLNGNYKTDYASDLITVTYVPELVFNESAAYDIPEGTVETPFTSTAALTATGGTGTYTFTIDPAVTGLSVNGENKLVYTRPSEQAATTATVKVTDSVTPALSATIIVAIGKVSAAPVAPTITTTTLEGGTVGTAYSQTLAATGDATITWSVSVGILPAGLALDAATGIISGTPTTAGTFTFTVKAVNDAGNSTKQLSVTIVDAPTCVITASCGTGGTITPNGECSVENGGSKTFTITPNSGYSISDVRIDNVSQGDISTYTFDNVTADHTIDAAFTYNGGGSKGGSTGGGSYSATKTYHIIKGANGEWESNSDNGLEITADGDYKDFLRAEVDGKIINSPTDCTVKSGSTIITLTPEYLKTLSAGQHTLTVVYRDGSVSTSFKVTMLEALPTDEEIDSAEETLPADDTPEVEVTTTPENVVTTAPENDVKPQDEISQDANVETPTDENPATGNSLSGILAVALLSLAAAGVTIKKREK